jgi:uncharacterized protein (DUF983 family)
MAEGIALRCPRCGSDRLTASMRLGAPWEGRCFACGAAWTFPPAALLNRPLVGRTAPATSALRRDTPV